MRILILGANGFIGHHLAIALSNTSNELILFSKNIDKELNKLKSCSRLNIVQGDFNDTNLLTDVVKGCDIVYHLISTSIPVTSWDNPIQEIQDNILPTIKLLDICSINLVKKVVFISSAGTVYGPSNSEACENMNTKPFSPYGISKVTIELYLEYYKKKTGMNYDVYRLSNPYGLGLHKKGFGVINTWLRSIRDNKKIKILGDGTAKKDYIFIDDAIAIISSSINRDLENSNTYNVCSGISIDLLELLEEIFKVTKKKVPIEFLESKESDNQNVHLSNKKLLKLMAGYDFISLQEGLNRIWKSLNK